MIQITSFLIPLITSCCHLLFNKPMKEFWIFIRFNTPFNLFFLNRILNFHFSNKRNTPIILLWSAKTTSKIPPPSIITLISWIFLINLFLVVFFFVYVIPFSNLAFKKLQLVFEYYEFIDTIHRPHLSNHAIKIINLKPGII